MSHIYAAQNFTHLLGLPGLSDTLLTNHFTLYEGYVNNTNILLKKMNAIREERLGGNDERKEESAELHRRYSWEYNGMKLHELYFENLTKEKTVLDLESDFGKKLIERFGSYETFLHNFTKNVGMFRGIGWVALIERDGGLGIIWINEHNEGLLANSKILLIMDVFEHAYMTDYGIKRAEYIETFFRSVDWKKVAERFGN
ncbi:MAG: Fe-Mn family superoxide dismutase [Candidatus Moranbacteria bacterium]|nr:Fe-Mn family superoxide dismutase [Candidatus Moranbacteria bacterium]MDD3964629.1 Fe-Mn family superoxide dismutase [Candidatus Moranbacteria bacterium]